MTALRHLLAVFSFKKIMQKKVMIAITAFVIVGVVAGGSLYVITKQKVNKANGIQAKVDVNNRGPQDSAQKEIVKSTQQAQAKDSKSTSPACVAARASRAKLLDSYNKENKRHSQKLKDLEEYWRANGGVEQDGYKRQVSEEGELYQSNLTKLNSATAKQADC